MTDAGPTSDVHALSIAVWNLTGGPLPRKTVHRLEGAVSSILKDAPNARLMHSVTKESE